MPGDDESVAGGTGAVRFLLAVDNEIILLQSFPVCKLAVHNVRVNCREVHVVGVSIGKYAGTTITLV